MFLICIFPRSAYPQSISSSTCLSPLLLDLLPYLPNSLKLLPRLPSHGLSRCVSQTSHLFYLSPYLRPLLSFLLWCLCQVVWFHSHLYLFLDAAIAFFISSSSASLLIVLSFSLISVSVPIYSLIIKPLLSFLHLSVCWFGFPLMSRSLAGCCYCLLHLLIYCFSITGFVSLLSLFGSRSISFLSDLYSLFHLFLCWIGFPSYLYLRLDAVLASFISWSSISSLIFFTSLSVSSNCYFLLSFISHSFSLVSHAFLISLFLSTSSPNMLLLLL